MMQDDLFGGLPRGPDYPERLRVMWRAYGRTLGHQCGSCRYFLRYRRQGKVRWAKCGLTVSTQSVATDWRAQWPACGCWEEDK